MSMSGPLPGEPVASDGHEPRVARRDRAAPVPRPRAKPHANALPSIFHERKQSDFCKCPSWGRNLIVCIDGTADKFSENNTNVVELYSRLVKDGKQLTFYISGIGSYATPSWKSPGYWMDQLTNILDMAFALRFEKIILSAYGWLADNYQHGDRIFLFGFSRGAYQVRALCAMIDIVGLLYKGNSDQIPFAYELYAAGQKSPACGRDAASAPTPASPSLEDSQQDTAPRPTARSDSPETGSHTSTGDDLLRYLRRAFRLPAATTKDITNMQKKFKAAFSRSVNVHLVGVWDTVSSIGLAREKTLPATTDGMRHTCLFRHALAMDERRVKFLPEYVNGGYGPEKAGPVKPKARACTSTSTSQQAATDDSLEESSAQKDDPGLVLSSQPHTKEVWFPGCHSDVGGGLPPEMTNFRQSLRWMSFEARLAGARFHPEEITYKNLPSDLSRSLQHIWRLLEIIPFKRLTYQSKEGTTRTWHLGSNRVLQRDQLLSWNVSEKLKEKLGMRVERDPYAEAGELLALLDKIIDDDGDKDKSTRVWFRESLRPLVRSVSGQNSLAADRQNVTKFLHGFKLLKDLRLMHATDELQSLISATLFGLVFSFDGTDSMKIGRKPQLAVGDFFAAVDQRISLGTALNQREEEMLSVLISLDSGKDALLDHSATAVEAMHRIMTMPAARGNLFSAVQSILALEGMTCSFDPEGRILNPDNCDLIAVGCALLPRIQARVISQTILDEREREMLKILRGTDRYPLGPLLDSLNDQALQWLHSLLQIYMDLAENEPGRDDVLKDLRYILDGFAFYIKATTSAFKPLHEILKPEPGSEKSEWTVPQLRGHVSGVSGVAFLFDGRSILSASLDGNIRIWDMHSGRITSSSRMALRGPLICLAVSRSGKIVSGSQGGICGVCNSKTGAAIFRSDNVQSVVCSVAIDSDRDRAASGGRDGRIHVFNIESKAIDRVLMHPPGPHPHDNTVQALAFSPSGKLLASSCLRTTRLWHLETGAGLVVYEHTHWVRSLAFAPGDSFLASGSDDGYIHVWDLRNGIVRGEGQPKLMHQIQAAQGTYIHRVKYSATGSHLVSTSGDSVRLWDAATGKAIGQPIRGHTDDVISLGISTNGSRIVSGSMDRTVHVWDRVAFVHEEMNRQL